MIGAQIGTISPSGIFFLIDQPADEDDIKGLPLVGSDGHLFARCLRAAGLASPGDVDDAFYRNLLPETRRLLWDRRPHTFASLLPAAVGREPDRWLREHLEEEAAACAALATLLCRTRPNVLVPLGPASLYVLTGRSAIDDWRGAVRLIGPETPIMSAASAMGSGGSADFLAGLKIIPTFHPSRVMQQYRHMGTVIADLMKVRHEARTASYAPLQVAIWMEPTLDDLRRFAGEHISRADLLTLDIETAGGQITCVQVGTSDRTCLVLPFVDYRRSDRSYWPDAESELAAWKWLAEVLDSETPKLGQNFGAYDCFYLLDKAGLTVRNYRHDLRLVHHLLQPELPKSLAFMGSLYSGMPRWKTDHKGEFRGGTEAKRDA